MSAKSVVIEESSDASQATQLAAESVDVDRFSYTGNDFPWWMLGIWICFIVFMTWYAIRYMVPNLSLWMEKPPVSKFVP
jgi:hypothetical protein